MRIAKRRSPWVAGTVLLALEAIAFAAVFLCLAATASGIDFDAVMRWLR